MQNALYRFGLEPETANDLAEQCAWAESHGLPHGVSAFARSSRPDAASARRADIEEHFRVHKTGRNSYHFTIELPKPMTDTTADLFNRLFGRTTA